ncbi:MAG TPA: hypothetical protein VN820_05620, partial [Acidimicrobiales bacterium]|nr:hypothetical protein [Acidimicrobiales bacterium]
MVTGPGLLSLGVERRRTLSIPRVRPGPRWGRRRRRGRHLVVRDDAAHKVGPQGDDLGDLLCHQVQDGVALGGLEVTQLRVESDGAVG